MHKEKCLFVYFSHHHSEGNALTALLSKNENFPPTENILISSFFSSMHCLHHQHEYVFEICHLVTTYLQFFYKHEMKKKYKESSWKKEKHWWGCIETNVKHLRKILFAMTLLVSHLDVEMKWGTESNRRRNKKSTFNSKDNERRRIFHIKFCHHHVCCWIYVHLLYNAMHFWWQ